MKTKRRREIKELFIKEGEEKEKTEVLRYAVR